MPKHIQYLFFPLTVLFTLVISVMLTNVLIIDNYLFIPGIVALPLILVFILFERYYPRNLAWNKSRNDLGTDLLQTFFTLPIASKISELLLPLLLYYPLVWLANSIGDNRIEEEIGLVLTFILTLIICEFFYYWMHRITHVNKHLWKLHAVHHGAKRVYWANSGRFHLIDAFLGSSAYFLPLILLGVGPKIIILIMTFSAITGFMEHVNINFKAGWLNYIFNTAELHRWHHSEIEKESNKNYGKALIIWDLLFGTFLFPKNKKVGAVGIKGEKVPVQFIKQFIYPFKKHKKQ